MIFFLFCSLLQVGESYLLLKGPGLLPFFERLVPFFFTEVEITGAFATTLLASFWAVFSSFGSKPYLACSGVSSRLSSADVFIPAASPPPSMLSRQLSISWKIFSTEAYLAFFAFPERGIPCRVLGLKPCDEEGRVFMNWGYIELYVQ